MEPTPLVLVHGGAGAWVPGSQRLLDAMGVCHEAASAGHARMLAGGSALDAVEAAVRALEDSPVLNAGRGSLPNRDGVIEMDALVMDGATLALGAVAAIRLVRNPVSVARLVAERTPHALLAGEGAAAFAEAAGVRRCSHEDLFVPRQTATEASDTVGAVAVDARGNVAVASSTGGTSGKLAGRVGDTPLPGCGAYADNASAAVAATGDGEAFMKLALSKRVCDGIANGAHPQAACEEAVALLAERLGAHGGLIAVDPSGRTGIAWNTAAMPHVVASGPR